MAFFLYCLTVLVLALFGLWSSAALYFDCRTAYLKGPLALLFAFAFFAGLYRSRRHRFWLFGSAALGAAVLSWWLAIPPSNTRDWQADVARMPEAEVNGDGVTIRDVRNCEYRAEFDYTCHWETREYALSSIRAVDLFLTDWGAPLIAHVMVSFDFGAGKHLAFSIEARKQKGQTYSAVLGFFRQYGLIYLTADERDVVRLRTNFRQGESVYLYRTRTTPADARALLLAYVGWINETKRHARWYNALTENCDRSVVRFLAESRIGGVRRLDWRGFLNGRGDRMLYELGDLVTDGLSFDQLRQQALINPIAKQTNANADFSAVIRDGRVGFR